MDFEALLLGRLLSANASKADSVFYYLRPGEFLAYEKEATFVWRFREKYGCFPTVGTLQAKFPNIVIQDSAEPIDYLAKQVRGNTLKSQINQRTATLFKMVKTLDDPDEVLAFVREWGRDASGSDDSFSIKSWKSAAGKIGTYKDRAAGKTKFFQFPNPGLRQHIFKVFAGELVTLQALPRIGKTWISCWWAVYAARSLGMRVGIVSLEIPDTEISDRSDAIAFKLPWTAMRRGTLTRRDLARWKLLANQLEREDVAYLFMNTKGTRAGKRGVDVHAVEAWAVESQLDLLIVDGAHLIDAPPKETFEKAYYKTAQFKIMARDHGMVVIQTIHLKQEFEAGGGKQKKLAGLGGGAWGAHAGRDSDYVIEFSAPMGANMPERRFVVEKSRNDGYGESTINMNFNPIDFREGALMDDYVEVVDDV